MIGMDKVNWWKSKTLPWDYDRYIADLHRISETISDVCRVVSRAQNMRQESSSFAVHVQPAMYQTVL